MFQPARTLYKLCICFERSGEVTHMTRCGIDTMASRIFPFCFGAVRIAVHKRGRSVKIGMANVLLSLRNIGSKSKMTKSAKIHWPRGHVSGLIDCNRVTVLSACSIQSVILVRASY